MILILIYWFILFVFASLSGIAFQNIFRLFKTNVSFTLLFGIIFQTLFLGICAFFYRINLEVFIVNCFIQTLFFFKFKTEFLTYCKSLFKSFSKKQVYLFIGLTVLIALKTTQLPAIFDNESYYIQTIKWLNEYGFVKGVANVHPFLAQFSFWHVLQSGFNFSFITNKVNDINGFLLLIGIYYFFVKHIQKGFNWSFFGILFLVFYYQFIGSPSPDLPTLVFLAIVFYEFIENSNDVKPLFIFIIFIIFIKISSVPFLLLILFLLIKNKKNSFYFVGISLFFGSVWVVKNIIITGYPLFPLRLFATNFDWKLPVDTMNYMYQNINNLGYAENASLFTKYSLFEKLSFWVKLNGLNGFFNKGILVLLAIMPITHFFKLNKRFRILYFILLFHLLFLLITSPQYRFFLPTFILFLTLISYEVSTHLKFSFKNLTITFSFVLMTISLFFDKEKKSKSTSFFLIHWVYPEPNTKYKSIKFNQKTIENFIFNDPKLDNIYETSDGKLPCVNEKVFYFYEYVPQQRTKDLKDGFYAKKLKNN